MSSCSSGFKASLGCVLLVAACALQPAWAQVSHSEQVQIKPPLIRTIEPPAPDATAADLEAQADEFHSQKLFLDAIDYYRAALAKSPNDARILNKVCRTQLMMTRWHEAEKSCAHSIRADRNFADPYNNLGVAMYGELKFRAAIRQYEKAITLDASSASFFSNLGAAYFARKDFDKAASAYQHALELDPDVFARSSRAGVQAQLPSPYDRARYDYTVAKLYAKMGLSDQSLEYLKRAMEEGYKDFKNVYKDEEFATLRKDRRFTELMAMRTPVLPEE
jgi:Tfp pilus assembly protein PilF